MKTIERPKSPRDDCFFMREALREAEKAALKGEVPIGAVIVKDGVVISRGHNLRESASDPTSHAEVIAIRKAARRLKSWRLTGTTLYVTLEPCLMCMGAILQARVPKIVFACFDPKAGACGSLYDLSSDRRLNHRVHAVPGVDEAEASSMLKAFFKALRAGKKRLKGSG